MHLCRRALFTLLIVLLASTLHASTEHDAQRVAAAVCCDRVRAVWQPLNSWGAECRSEVPSPSAKNRFLAATNMKGDSRKKQHWPSESGWDLCEGQSVSHEAVRVFCAALLCADLPHTHRDLVTSAFGMFVDEDPHQEDALVDEIVSACSELSARLQRRSGLDVSSLAASLQPGGSTDMALNALCPQPCTWVEDGLDGGRYEL